VLDRRRSTPDVGVLWNWNASRALSVPRFSGVREGPSAAPAEMSADDLLSSVPLPGFGLRKSYFKSGIPDLLW